MLKRVSHSLAMHLLQLNEGQVETWRAHFFPVMRTSRGQHSSYYVDISRETVVAEIECTRHPDMMVQTNEKHRKIEAWG